MPYSTVPFRVIFCNLVKIFMDKEHSAASLLFVCMALHMVVRTASAPAEP